MTKTKADKGRKGRNGIKGLKGLKGLKDGGARAAARTWKAAARTEKAAARTGKAAARTAKCGKAKNDIVRLRDWTREHRKDPAYRAKIRANAAAHLAQLKREAEIGRLAMTFVGLIAKFIAEAKMMGVAK